MEKRSQVESSGKTIGEGRAREGSKASKAKHIPVTTATLPFRLNRSRTCASPGLGRYMIGYTKNKTTGVFASTLKVLY